MKVLADILTRKYYVIHWDSGSESHHTTYSCLGKKANKLELLFSSRELSIEEILSEIPKNSTIILCISGKAVLSRYAENKNDILFPEIDQDDFYIQKNNSKSNVRVASICRKEYIDFVLLQFQSSRHFIVDISLSPSIATFLEGIVDESIFTVENLCFKLENSKIRSIVETTDPIQNSVQIKLKDQSYKIDEALGIASLVKFFEESHTTTGAFKLSIEQSKFYQKTKAVGYGFLVLIFLLLLINFFVFEKTETKLHMLKTSNQKELLIIRQIETLQIQISEYSELINSSGKTNDLPLSVLLDRFAYLKPADLWLNTLEIYPLVTEQAFKNNIRVDCQLIRLYGNVKSPVLLNKYIRSLREEGWVRDIVMRNYSTNKEGNNAVFILEILI